ncbi:MAG: PEP-CTERM sorting domain-containing protein [Bryobacteraceae bacterium]
MKKLTLAAAVLMAFALTLSATPVCTSGDDVLSAGYSCYLDGLVFDNFHVAAAAGFQMHLGPATGISGNEVVLSFNHTPLLAGDDINFWMRVTGWQLGIDLYNAGSGAASIQETACDAQTYPNPGCSGNILAQISAGANGSASALYAGGPQNVVYIWKDIGVGLAVPGGHLSAFNESFTIPEPVTLSLIGGGLLGLGLLRRRVRS